jgi:hypothetical protein
MTLRKRLMASQKLPDYGGREGPLTVAVCGIMKGWSVL